MSHLHRLKTKIPKKWQARLLIVRKNWLLPTIGAIGIIVIFVSARHAHLEYRDTLNAMLLWLTAVVLLWYTKETYQIKKLAQEQNITSIRPFLRLQWQTNSTLVLVNEGKGVAVDLKPRYEANGQTTDLLVITAMAAAPGSSTSSFIPSNFTVPDPISNTYDIKIKYKDIESRRYVAVFRSSATNNDKFTIIRQKEGSS